MRIIAGEFRGRKLASPKGLHTRPTSDRLREAIFSSLSHRFGGVLHGLQVADIFAGTGAMGFEAISRGATSAIFVEKHQGLELIKANAIHLGCADKCKFLGADARQLPAIGHQLDLIFLDPPYGKELAEPALMSALANGWLQKGAIAVVEISEKDSFQLPDGFNELQRKTTSRTTVITLEVAS
jgi:16S rRNA (guanine966-N2)-methyltransferase